MNKFTSRIDLICYDASLFKVFRYSFSETVRYLSITLTGILSLSDRYKIFVSDNGLMFVKM